MNIASQHSGLNYVSIINKMDCEYLNKCYINKDFTVVDKQNVIDGLKISFLTICSDINSVYLLSAIENISDNTFIENIRLSLEIVDKEGKKVGCNNENTCHQHKIKDTIYTISTIDISEPLALSECEIILREIRRNRKTLIKSENSINNIETFYQMPLTQSAGIDIELNSVEIKKNILNYEFTIVSRDNRLNYNTLISLSCNKNPILDISCFSKNANNEKPSLLKYNRIENSNKYQCSYDLKNINKAELSNIYFYYYTASVETTKCDIRFNYNLSYGYNGIAHLIKVDRAIDINSKLFKVKEFRIGNITTRIIIEGSLLSISDSVDNVLKIYNGKRKLSLISAKCTSKKTIYEFKTSIQDSNMITVKIADKFI